jgi:hypothetical protein
MNEFSVHPGVYATGEMPNLLRMLEQAWIREITPGQGAIYMVSGFGNFNGGVRFFEPLREHIRLGGTVQGIFGGSTSQRLTSRQLVRQLLEVGANVQVINRKRILHAKIYGTSVEDRERLIVSSGNFTGPGMSLNIEASLSLDVASTRGMGFTWANVMAGFGAQNFDVYQPTLADDRGPGWGLLYDEYEQDLKLDESEESTLILTLSRADTARIQAAPGTNAGKGSQYFWLSRDSYGFFPPLAIRNRIGVKATFSCLINIRYIELERRVAEARVTFEAENNLDFRLGTGPLRYTGLASPNDIAALSRIGEQDYELRIVRRADPSYGRLLAYATTFIGNEGKRSGYVANAEFEAILKIRLARPARVAAPTARRVPIDD